MGQTSIADGVGVVSGRTYNAFHIGPSVSVHNNLIGMVAVERGSERTSIHTTTDSLYFSIGNLAVHKWRLLVGRFYAPFGINFSSVMEVIDFRYRSHRFFQTAKNSISLISWDSIGTSLEVSLSTDGKQLSKNGRESHVGAYSLRITHDISALNGTKIVASYLESNEGEKRYGFGVLNVSQFGAVTNFEWVRLKDVDHVGHYPFYQLIRLNYTEAFRRFEGRWIFEYQDELESNFQTTVGFDKEFWKFFQLRSGIGYLRDRFDSTRSHWFLTLGIKGETP